MFDEVQTGIGHTGHFFGYQHEGVVPDVMTLAKGLAGGMPIGVMMAKAHIAEALGPGTHGSTFGGNPVSCSAALAVLQTIEEEHILDHVRQVGAHFVDGLTAFAEKISFYRQGAWAWPHGGGGAGPARWPYGHEMPRTGIFD